MCMYMCVKEKRLFEIWWIFFYPKKIGKEVKTRGQRTVFDTWVFVKVQSNL